MFSAAVIGSLRRLSGKQRRMLFFTAFVIAVTLLALLTIIIYANHDCIGDGCPICRLIRYADAMLKQIGKAAFALGALCAVYLFLPLTVPVRLITRVSAPTPVQAKIRLNN